MGEAWGTIRDVLVLAYLVALRVGVPILVTLMLGAWIQRYLERPEKELARTYRVGDPCWEFNQCPDAKEAQCVAAARPDLPCWLAIQVNGGGMSQACYSCPVFT